MPRSSPNVQRVFIATRPKPSEAVPHSKNRNYKVIELKSFPVEKKIDLRKASLDVHHILTSAQEIARRKEVALEGPPSDSLESLLAMRIKQAQK
jgi:hypothetical protein